MRVVVRAAGERHVSAWAPAGDEPVEVVRETVEDNLADRLGVEQVLDMRMPDGSRRLLMVRAIEWVDVEVRRR